MMEEAKTRRNGMDTDGPGDDGEEVEPSAYSRMLFWPKEVIQWARRSGQSKKLDQVCTNKSIDRSRTKRQWSLMMPGFMSVEVKRRNKFRLLVVAIAGVAVASFVGLKLW